MPGQPVSDLQDMLAGMEPVLDDEAWCIVTLPQGEAAPPGSFAVIHEDEGTTGILRAFDAPGDAPRFGRITLQVHSALDGVGLTAAVSGVLAEAGIACNVVAAFHHDHLFMPWNRREDALAILQRLSLAAGR